MNHETKRFTLAQYNMKESYINQLPMADPHR